MLALIGYNGGKGELGCTTAEGGADGAVPLAEVECVGLGKPHMAVDAGALVEPSVAEAGIDAGDDVVFGAVGEEVGEVELEGRVAVVVAADEASVDEEDDVTESAIKLDRNALAEIGGGDFKLAAIPTDT